MTKSEYDTKDVMRLLGDILLGGGLALAVCCGILFLGAAAVSMGWLRESLSGQFAVASCAVGTACGAGFTVLRCRRRTLLLGLSVSAVFFLLLLTIGIFAYGTASLERGGLALLCGSLCGGAAVGLLCGRPKKKKRRA